jgi:hypothetical protein
MQINVVGDWLQNKGWSWQKTKGLFVVLGVLLLVVVDLEVLELVGVGLHNNTMN